MRNDIPKVIHYCWFGGNELTELSLKCIESWKKYLPDYTIKRWDESNFDINMCDYVKEAYNEKKWAFVSDYARFWILYNEGGLYFDTDVEVIRPLKDIIKNGPFMGCEPPLSNSKVKVAPGLGIAAFPKMKIFKRFLDYYNNLHFIEANGDINVTTIVEYTTSILSEYGWKSDLQIHIVEGLTIYPPEYFCPMNYETGEINITENTYSIHRYSASWKTRTQQHQGEVLKKLIRVFGKKLGYKIWRIYTFPYRVSSKVKNKGMLGTIKFIDDKIRGNSIYE